jgi:uncharacterized membrane protein YdfJ with MMPL/SSD domain
MEFIPIKEACARYSVSESKMRRIIKDLKLIDLSQLEFETLKNGGEKILISTSYLDRLLNTQKQGNQQSSNSGSQDIVNYLMKQIEEKDKQISQLHVLLGQATQLQIEAPKKKRKWWQRKDKA